MCPVKLTSEMSGSERRARNMTGWAAVYALVLQPIPRGDTVRHVCKQKIKIAKQLFGESKEEFEQAHEQGKKSATQTNPRRRARSFDGAILQEQGAIKKQRRAIQNSERSD